MPDVTARAAGAPPRSESTAGLVLSPLKLSRLVLSRRSAIRGALAASAIAATAGSVAACDSGPSAEQLTAEALLPLADAAHADAATALALSVTDSDYAAALKIVADQRTEHATALTEEITRLHQDTAKQIVTTPAKETGDTGGSGGTGITVDDFRTRLTESGRAAGKVAVGEDGYVAGLAGAVSASVASIVEVALAE